MQTSATSLHSFVVSLHRLLKFVICHKVLFTSSPIRNTTVASKLVAPTMSIVVSKTSLTNQASCAPLNYTPFAVLTCTNLSNDLCTECCKRSDLFTIGNSSMYHPPKLSRNSMPLPLSSLMQRSKHREKKCLLHPMLPLFASL